MKSKSAKRVLSILIIFALSVATASPAIAVEPNNSHESDIQVFSAFDQFANVFPDVDDTVAAQSADNAAPSTQTGGSADYTYTITIDPLTNTGTASVNLTLNIGEHLYPLTVSGDVKNVSIREDIEMVTGILCGSVDIAGKTYAVDGCLRKFSTDERINMGLSLVPPDYNANPESNLILLAIGISVMTGEILQRLTMITQRPLQTWKETMKWLEWNLRTRLLLQRNRPMKLMQQAHWSIRQLRTVIPGMEIVDIQARAA